MSKIAFKRENIYYPIQSLVTEKEKTDVYANFLIKKYRKNTINIRDSVLFRKELHFNWKVKKGLERKASASEQLLVPM